MSRDRFEQILPILEQARKRTKPRRVDLYEVWCAVLYLLRTRCQWRALPSDFPKSHAIAVTTAEVTDRKGALQALDRCKADLGHVHRLLCGSGYTGEPFARGMRDTLGEQVTVPIAQRSELHTFKVMPRRWIVERSFAWLEKNRRLWKNCERKLNTRLQFIPLAFLALLLRRS